MPDIAQPPPVPASPAKPSAARPRARAKIVEDAGPPEDVPFGVQFARSLTGSESMGLTISMLLHAVVLVVLALRGLGVSIPVEELLIAGSQNVGFEHELEESVDVSLTKAGGEMKAEQLITPNDLLVAESPDFELPSSVDRTIARDAADGAGNDTREGTGNDEDGTGEAPSGDPEAGKVVKKGSFTVFYPKNPPPRRPYWIVISVKMPEGYKKRYSATDLAGTIRGNEFEESGGRTADYIQRIPWDKTLKLHPLYSKHTFRRVAKGRWTWLNPESRYRFIPVIDGTATIKIKIPGAAVAKIKDTIKIKSKLLDEEQELELIFKDKTTEGAGKKRKTRR